MAFLLRLTLAMIGIWNPIVAIALILGADVFMVAMGIMGLSWSMIIVYIILGGLAMYRINR